MVVGVGGVGGDGEGVDGGVWGDGGVGRAEGCSEVINILFIYFYFQFFV